MPASPRPGPEPPAEVSRLAEQRSAAREAKDYAASDRLRDEVAALGWLVRDTKAGQVLSERPPYDVAATVASLPDRTAEPDEGRCTVGILVEGWGGDVRICVQALLEHTPPDVAVLLLDNGSDAGREVHELAVAHPDRVREVHVERPAGWAEARQAMLRADTAAVHVLLDPSTVLEGDALSPVLACLDDPTVAAAGWRGVRLHQGDWTQFEDAGPGEVEALLGYLLAVRRGAAQATPLPAARFYRNADMEWSFLLRDAGGRLMVPPGELPVRQDRHRGYHESDPVMRDRESKKTYDRFLRRFRGREDLRLLR